MKEHINHEEKAKQRQIRKDAFSKLGFIFLGILLLADTIQLARFGDIVERVDQYNRGVVDELGGFRRDIITFAGDLSEMRSFLLLPTKDYSFMDKQTEITGDGEEQESSSTEKAVYQFLASFVDEKKSVENAHLAEESIKKLSVDEKLVAAAVEMGLSVGAVESNDEGFFFKLSNKDDVAIFAIVMEKYKAQLQVQSALGTQNIDQVNIQQLLDYLKQNRDTAEKTKLLLEDRKSIIRDAVSSPEAVAAKEQKKLVFNDQPQESAELLRYFYTNEEGTKVVIIELLRKDGMIKIGEKAFSTLDELRPALVEVLKNANASTEMEKMVQQRQAELQKIFSEEAFQSLLKEQNLTIANTPREEYNKLLFDIINSDEKIEFSFAIELSSGLLKVLKDDQEIDLSSFLQGSKKKS